MKNRNLNKAKVLKNDEFYTQFNDIENEIKHYKEHFRDKIVFCNCDDPTKSNFFKYFALNFEHLGLKKLISTHFEFNNQQSYKLEIDSKLDLNNDGQIDLKDLVKTPLNGNGDFRSEECIELLKESDIVVTNPPFSLFREYVKQLDEYQKKFIIIGNMNAITYKEVFKLIKDNKLWLGVSPSNMPFKLPDNSIKRVNSVWYTNLVHNKRNKKMILYKTYEGNEKDYPQYDNYDAINVDKVKEIPLHYEGAIGVPITFLGNYNPEQFDVLGTSDNGAVDKKYKLQHFKKHNEPYINGEKKYKRIFIKIRKGDDDKDLIIDGKSPYFRIIIKKRESSSVKILYKTYEGNEKDYPKYDNYDAINVDKVKEIPLDYEGAIGVPITFLENYNPEQFEIIGQGQGNLYRELTEKGLKKEFVENYYKNGGKGLIKENHPVLGYYKNNKAIIPYMRIIIKRKV